MKISVIVPVYKVENYLKECLDSINSQTFKDFELILVDDGSPDSCGEMCEHYAAKHPNTKVIHQENKGLSEARNQAVKIASGEYITFIDSDDYVSSDYLEYLLYLADKYNVDVATANMVSFWDGEPPCTTEQPPTDEKMASGEALKRICYNHINICACGKIYKRYLVENNPYPSGQLYEDTATTYKIVGEAKSMAYGTHCVYFWRQRRGSITHAIITEKHLYGITAAKEQLSYIQTNYPEAIPAARARCVMKIIDLAYRVVMGNRDRYLFRRIRQEINPFLIPLLKDKKSSLSLKTRALVLKCGYIPYVLLSKIYSLIK